MMSQDGSFSDCGPYLVMFIAPENKTRFRYESEGGSHGGLTGKEKKTYPTVKLENYNGPSKDIFIRVSLCTEKKTEHVLTFKKKKMTGSQNYVDENLRENYTAEFKSLTILSKKKEEVCEALMDQKLKTLGRNLSKHVKDKFVKENSEDVKKEAKEILNSVVLRFDAFERKRPTVQICRSLFSEPICNQKASSKGELKITRMSKVFGSWRGGEDIILLCDKIQKDNVKILFYEKDVENGWKAYATFNPSDVHYQVAIPFKTPQYKGNVEKEVAIALERQDELSEPRTFTFIPDEFTSKKRKLDFCDNLLLSSTDVSSTGSSSAAVSEDSSQEVSDNSSARQSEDLNVFLPQFSSNDNLQLNFNNDLDFGDIWGLPPGDFELLAEMPNCDLLLSYNEDVDMQNETDEVQSEERFSLDNLSLFSPNQIQVDSGKIDGQLAADWEIPIRQIARMKIRDSECDLDISKPLYNKQPGSIKSLENQKKMLGKYLKVISKTYYCDNTLLHIAVLQNKSITIPVRMSKMVNSGIINAQNCYGQTALSIAVEKNSDKIQELLNSGSNPNIKNAQGNNCFHIASRNNFYKCMEDLLRYSKFPHEVNAFNYKGLTPLHIAIKNNSSACFDILMKNSKINLNVIDKTCGRSLLHYAAEYQPSYIPSLKEAKIDVDIQDFEGNTPLHIACAADDPKAVKQLLLAGSDPSIRNYKKNYPDSDEESSDDETVVGQTPADLTTNPIILELLKQTPSTKEKSGFTCSTDHSECETLTENLCSLLDSSGRWQEVANYILDEKHLDSLKLSESPTRALLNFMKKESGENYIENFKSYLEMVGFDDAVQMITQSQPLIEL